QHGGRGAAYPARSDKAADEEPGGARYAHRPPLQADRICRRRDSRVPRISRASGTLRKVIVLDTNVLSALMRPQPDASVRRWLDGLDEAEVHTTAITI